MERRKEKNGERRAPGTMGAIHSTKIPTGKSGPPQKVDPFFRNFSGWTEPIHWVLDRNFRKFWLNGSRPLSYQTSSKRSPPLWLLIGTRKLVFFWHQSEAKTAATVWNWSGKTLSQGALLAVLFFCSFHICFSTCLDFPSPPLSAPGSPRMSTLQQRVL